MSSNTVGAAVEQIPQDDVAAAAAEQMPEDDDILIEDEVKSSTSKDYLSDSDAVSLGGVSDVVELSNDTELSPQEKDEIVSCDNITFHKGSKDIQLDKDTTIHDSDEFNTRQHLDHKIMAQFEPTINEDLKESILENFEYSVQSFNDAFKIIITEIEFRLSLQEDPFLLEKELFKCPIKSFYFNKNGKQIREEQCNALLNKNVCCTLLQFFPTVLHDFKQLLINIEDQKKNNKVVKLKRIQEEREEKIKILREKNIYFPPVEYNTLHYIKNLIKIRDSPLEIYEEKKCKTPKGFNQIGVHPLTLQYISVESGGCRYISLTSIIENNDLLHIKYDNLDNKNIYKYGNEICIFCGRICISHYHGPINGQFPFNVWKRYALDKDTTDYWENIITKEQTKIDPKQKDPECKYTHELNDIFPCGGRAEMIARVWAIYSVIMNCKNRHVLMDLTLYKDEAITTCKKEAFALANKMAGDPVILKYIQTIITTEPPFRLIKTIYKETRQNTYFLKDMLETEDSMDVIINAFKEKNSRFTFKDVSIFDGKKHNHSHKKHSHKKHSHKKHSHKRYSHKRYSHKKHHKRYSHKK
jgi:hypothetical protein